MKHQEDKIMAVVEELIRSEEDGTLSFGNFTLPQKSKVNEFEHGGDKIGRAHV